MWNVLDKCVDRYTRTISVIIIIAWLYLFQSFIIVSGLNIFNSVFVEHKAPVMQIAFYVSATSDACNFWDFIYLFFFFFLPFKGPVEFFLYWRFSLQTNQHLIGINII